MYLKSIRVQGFKTFARRTELPFSRGITAIVGPNGSGKSNLVDAIRWALGERNARGLRGHRMEDVIYAGGPGKSAVGMAEVTLLIDNADQRLNVEFNEIEVARRLYRSGESEYLVNGARARLKDIDALLTSTGLRQDGYAVTAQNDIDFVIQAAPVVRRELIEEAAGVRRLRLERQEAVTRLGEAERDMRRARDVLQELTPRAEELRAQASAARDYQSIAEQLRVLQGSLARDSWRKAMLQLRRARGREQAARTRQSQANATLSDFEPRYAANRDALLRAREARWTHQQLMGECRLRLAEAQHQVRIVEERGQAVAKALQAARREIERLSESERAGIRVVEELEHEVERTAGELESALALVEAASAEESRRRDLHHGLEEQRAALLQARQDRHRDRLAAQAEIRQVEGRLQFLEEQRQQAADAIQEWALRSLALEAELGERARSAQLASEEAGRCAAALDDLERQAVALSEAHAQAERAAVEAAAVCRAREAEAAALRVMRDRSDRPSPLAQAALALRPLVEMVSVEERHRAAVEAALEGALSAWVALDAPGAERAIDLLRGNPAALRETILLDPALVRGSMVPLALRSLRSVIKADAALDPLLSHLLERMALVDTLAEAQEVVAAHPDLRAVTLDGELVTGWSYRGGRSERAPLQLQAQIREVEEALAAALEARGAAERGLEGRKAALRGLVDDRAAAAAALEGCRARDGELVGRLHAARSAFEREGEAGRRMEEPLKRVLRLRGEAGSELDELSRREQEMARLEERIQDDLRRTEADLAQAAGELTGALQRRQEMELQTALARQRHEDLVRQLARARDAWRSHGDDLAQRTAAAGALAAEPARLRDEGAHWLDRLRAIEAELESLEAAPLPDAGALSAMEAQVREDEQRNVALQVEVAHTDDAVEAAVTEVETAQTEVDRCALALRDDPGSLDEEEVPELDWQKTEREVARLQRQLNAMGAVNLLAPEEYDQVSDRCQTLTSQLQDLEDASTQLLELRRRLEQEIDDRFRTVFQAVAINFQEFFGELFPGGRATLRLEDEVEDPLDAGVEILAQTPGKRLQQLTLLSGGERALTALAFLFALQAVNPSPFYVLDEVDAALDDANVVRFNRVLARLAREQQFLIVTHNHSTMAQAEVLYGVTLAEHGVSRIVSVRLNQDEAMPRLRERTA
ncbi:MAG: chromosome segregation protein SMC [Chloroflexi bacterium]|nr:MAG: chromosome segregation protein SMC [Chloroflexota bacterium]